MGNYRELIVWQKAMKLAAAIYRTTEGFPRREMYGLTAQMRRAAVSVPSNIAEGQGRRTGPEFQHFLGNARGSLVELETQVQLAQELGFLSAALAGELIAQTAEVGRLINGLMDSLQKPKPKAV